MDKLAIEERVKSIAQKAAGDHGVELVHVEIAGTKRDAVVRIYIDKPDGVTLDDCSVVSREVEAVMDAEDFMASRYVLEVSSPGIERELYSIEDFRRFIGRSAKVKTKVETAGQKTFVGIITGVDGNTISLDDRTRGAVSFDYSNIAKANLKIDLSKEFRGR
jgi:ribosome maturation factor RimP